MSTSMPVGEPDVESLDVIDEAHLATFTDGDLALEDELGELFLSTARGYLKRMKEAVEEERSWSAEAHALKGASGNLGARRVAALAQRAEFMPPSAVEILVIEQAIDEVKSFFSQREQ
ncbi:MAG: Hpt domain-containing protein [Geminicoccaceae bacterium]